MWCVVPQPEHHGHVAIGMPGAPERLAMVKDKLLSRQQWLDAVAQSLPELRSVPTTDESEDEAEAEVDAEADAAAQHGHPPAT